MDTATETRIHREPWNKGKLRLNAAARQCGMTSRHLRKTLGAPARGPAPPVECLDRDPLIEWLVEQVQGAARDGRTA